MKLYANSTFSVIVIQNIAVQQGIKVLYLLFHVSFVLIIHVHVPDKLLQRLYTRNTFLIVHICFVSLLDACILFDVASWQIQGRGGGKRPQNKKL